MGVEEENGEQWLHL